MTPDQAIAEAGSGSLRPVYLVLGEERYLEARVVAALREAAMKGGIEGFNDERFVAGEAHVDAVLSACRMLPMMAARKVVTLRQLERWEKSDDDAPKKPKRDDGPSPLDKLAEYVKDAPTSTVLVLQASKLHGQRRLVTAAKKGDFVVSCEPPRRDALPGFARKLAAEKGHALDDDAAMQLAEHVGSDLSAMAEALERLSLYVGEGARIDEAAVGAMITKVVQSTVWELIDALGQRRLGPALHMLYGALEPKSGGLPLLGGIAWSVRQMAKLETALAEGARGGELAARAGIPPFKLGETQERLRRLPPGTTARWLGLLADADLALKSSRRTPESVLETMVIAMCR